MGEAKLTAAPSSCKRSSPSICQGNRSHGIHQSVGQLRVTAVLFLFLGNFWEYLNMSIITEDWLLGSAEVSLSFLPLSLSFSSSLPVGQSAILPSLARKEVRDSHSSPDVYPWQLQLPASASVMVEERS